MFLARFLPPWQRALCSSYKGSKYHLYVIRYYGSKYHLCVIAVSNEMENHMEESKCAVTTAREWWANILQDTLLGMSDEELERMAVAFVPGQTFLLELRHTAD